MTPPDPLHLRALQCRGTGGHGRGQHRGRPKVCGGRRKRRAWMPITPAPQIQAGFEVDCPIISHEEWLAGDLAILRLLPRARAAVLLLPGWEPEQWGARLERDWAIHLNLEVFDPPATPGGDPARRGVQGGPVPVTFVPIGEARLDLYTDAMLARYRPGDVRGAARPGSLTSPRTDGARSWYPAGTGGCTGPRSATSSKGSGSSAHRRAGSLMLTSRGASTRSRVYLVLEVKDGIRSRGTISMLVTGRRQLDDAHSRQTVLAGGADVTPGDASVSFDIDGLPVQLVLPSGARMSI